MGRNKVTVQCQSEKLARVVGATSSVGFLVRKKTLFYSTTKVVSNLQDCSYVPKLFLIVQGQPASVGCVSSEQTKVSTRKAMGLA